MSVINKLRIEILKKLLENGSLTRPELLKLTGIRAATVFEAIDSLKNEGMIQEPERCGRHTGRKAPKLILSPNRMWLAGIDFQTRGTLGVITDMTGSILFRAELPALNRASRGACLNEIREILRMLRDKAGKEWEKVAGIGFADPGLVDVEKAVSIRAVNVPGWENLETGKWLEKENKLPSGIWPECTVKTFMEYQARLPGCPGTLFHLEMEDGIGGGFVKDGICFAGDTHQAMEIGHIVIDSNGPLCQCGNRGCLEAIAGENGIRRSVHEAISNGVDTVLRMEEFSLEKFTECARYDKASRIIASNVSDSIGRALSVAVTLLNPSTIVLSGKLTGLGDLLMSSIRRTLDLNCFPGTVRDLKIEFSTLKKEDTARGAALLMRNKLLELP